MKTSYERVIPRDFFNEAKLLKCMGLLALKILDGQTPCKIQIEENGEPFKIAMTDGGYLTVSNYPVMINGLEIAFKTVYNSKSNYPFVCEHESCEYLVFNEIGEFDEEFIEFANSLTPYPCVSQEASE